MNQCKSAADESKSRAIGGYVPPIMLMAGIGGASWQPVRFAGQGCGWTMGLLWGLAWWFMSAAYGNGRRPCGSAYVVLACVAGFYFGGMHGYGQFHHWIKGVFELERAAGRTAPIHPALGYWWVFLCGAGWGGVAGAFLSWSAADRSAGMRAWVLRLGLILGMAWLFRAVAVARPEWIMPLWDQVEYQDAQLCPDCTRTTRTLEQSMMWLGFCVGALLTEALRRDWRGFAFIGLMGLGFGVAFTAFEWLHLFTDASNEPVFWWSLWEASNGLIGGAVLGLCFCLFNRPGPRPGAEGKRGNLFHYPRAEFLAGLCLPLLASLYHVIPFRAARGARWLGLNEELTRQTATMAVVLFIIAAGLLAVCAALRAPSGTAMCQSAAARGRIFLAVYLVFFFLSYLPRFALYGTTAGIPITQGAYAIAFGASLWAYWRLCFSLNGRTC